MATRTISNAGGNYNSVSTWVEGAVPTSADDVVCTASSGNLVINVTAAAKSVDFTNYVGTVSGTNTWTISGNVKLVTAVTFSGSWIMSVNATSSLTSNGKTFNLTFTFTGTNTYTFVDNWIFSGTVSATATATLNRTSVGVGEITFKGTVNSGTFVGTSVFTFDGATVVQPIISNVMIVNTTSGTFNITSFFTIISTSFTYVAGNTNCNTSTVRIYGNCTIDVNGNTTLSVSRTNGINFYNLTLGNSTYGSGTITLNSNMTCISTLTNGVSISTTLNGNTLYAGGNITINNGNGAGSGVAVFSGTTSLVICGTGTWQNAAGAVGSLNMNTTINTAGTLTLGTTAYFNAATLTYTAGTVVTTGSTLVLFGQSSSTVTLNTAGVVWNNITNNSAANTLILNSLLTLTGNFTVCNVTNAGANTLTFSGSYGISGGTLYSITQTANSNITFAAGVTYNPNSIICYPEAKNVAGNLVFKSSSSGVQANINVPLNSNNTLLLLNATDINSSGGKTLRTIRGTLSNATNWVTATYTDLATIVSVTAT